MTKLQNFHPIYTAHYRWEFLSKLSGKAIQDFLKTDIAATSHFINQAMQKIMANTSLVWGVTSKNSEKLIGLIQLQDITEHNLNLKLSFIDDVPLEILERLNFFIKQQLHVTKIIIDSQSTNYQQDQDFFN